MGQLLAVLGVGVVAAVVPLLMDLGNLADTYYAPKARALMIFAPVLAASVLLSLVAPVVRRSIPWWPLLSFAAAALAATALSVHPAWSLRGAPWRHEGLLTLLAYVLVFAATSIIGLRAATSGWLLAALLGGTLAGLYGIAQYLGYEWLVRDILRVEWWQAFSTTGNPNVLGAYMVLTLPLAIGAVALAREWMHLVPAMVSLMVLYLAGLFTYSRATWAALMVMLPVTALAASRAHPSCRCRIVSAAVLLGLITVVFLIPGGPLQPRSQERYSPQARARTVLTVSDASDSMAQRSYLWRVTLDLVARRPALGYGPEALPLVFPQQWDEDKRRLFGPEPRVIDKAHNETLDMAASVGVLGLTAFCWLVIVALRRAWAVVHAGGRHAVLGLACGAGILGYLLVLQFHFSTVSVAPVFWSTLGLAASLEPPAREAS